MAQQLNQFTQTAERGQVAYKNGNSNVMSAMVDSGVSGTLRAGDAVRLVGTSKGLPKVAPLEANDTAAAVMFIVNNYVRSEGIKAGDRIEVMYTGGFMRMRADGAIAAGARVAYDTGTGNVSQYEGTGRVIGVSIEAASAEGDIISVYVQS